MANRYDTSNIDLYRLLKTRGYSPDPKDDKNKRTSPDKASVLHFTFKKDGKEYGDAWILLDTTTDSLVLYYGNEQLTSPAGKDERLPYDDSWYGFKKHLKTWATSRQLGFDLKNKDELGDDMSLRTVNEAYHPINKKTSYNDNIPTVKIIVQHSRPLEEGEKRFRSIDRIFLENTNGERFLAPTSRPGLAQIYARHIAEGGVPNDDKWNHIKELCEEYTKMAGFVRATRKGNFNESAQELVNEGINHYQSLRETLGKLRGRRGYNTYFESWTPVLMEEEDDDDSINELFVQETLDPRIESVMPILSKLRKKENSMKEVTELEEWADSIVEGEIPLTLVEDDVVSPIESAIANRVIRQHASLVGKHGPEAVMNAIKDVAYRVGDVEEIGSSDVSIWVKEVIRSLSKSESVDEAKSDSFRRKFNKAMSWDYSDPKKMIKQIRGYTDQDLLDLYHHPEDERQLDGSARSLQLKLIRQELKRRFGLTPKGNIKPDKTTESLSPQQKKIGQLGPTEKIDKKGAVGKLVGESIPEDDDLDESAEKSYEACKACDGDGADKDGNVCDTCLGTGEDTDREIKEESKSMSTQFEKGTPEHAVIMELINGERDTYDILSHPKTDAERNVSEKLMIKYDDIAGERRLHPDDDFESIIELLIVELTDEYAPDAYVVKDDDSDKMLNDIKRLIGRV